MSSSVSSAFSTPGLCLVVARDAARLASVLPELLPTGHRLQIQTHASALGARKWLASLPVTAPPLRLALIDLEFPDDTGMQLLRRLTSLNGRFSRCTILALADTYDRLAVALAAGAAGFGRHDDSPARLAELLACIDRGEPPLLPSTALLLLAHFRTPKTQACPDDVLSPRERDVLTFMARGFGAGEALHRLGLSPGLLQDSLRTIYRKLSVSN